MAHHFREAERRQKALLPADMMEWLPENDIVHLIVEAVELMDLSKRSATSSAVPDRRRSHRRCCWPC
jgi:hypothetical protein